MKNAAARKAKLHWFYIDAPLDVCMARDPKGMYKQAQTGQIKQLIDYPFETPRSHECENHVSTITQNVDECYHSILTAWRRAI